MEYEERPAKMRKLDHTEEKQEQESREEAQPMDTTSTAQVSNSQTPDEAEIQKELTQQDQAENGETTPAQTAEAGEEAPKLSKNQMKKAARLARWESGREDRKEKRKQKIKERKERKREAYQAALANSEKTGAEVPPMGRPHKHANHTRVPLTVIFDCSFEDLMYDNEMKSLGLQITRCYSDTRKSKYQPHIVVSSFGGKMKERFDGILAKQYLGWKGVRFCEEDFVAVSEKAKEWMRGDKGGVVEGAIAEGWKPRDIEKEAGTEAVEDMEDDGEGEVVYLSSESDNVLTHLKPYSTYIIGGLVDKNRHKGICHKRAMERGIKTAKLPIGEFLHMKSRQVLVTNHVLEIMLKWMECGDWGKAFMAVLPERKGAVLKSEYEESVQKEEDEMGDKLERGENAETGADSKVAKVDIGNDKAVPSETHESLEPAAA